MSKTTMQLRAEANVIEHIRGKLQTIALMFDRPACLADLVNTDRLVMAPTRWDGIGETFDAYFLSDAEIVAAIPELV